MLKGTIKRNTTNLYTEKGLIHRDGLWSFEGKVWNEESGKWTPLVKYGSVVYALASGDLWYYAEQNNFCMPIVRIADRNRIYDMMESIGLTFTRTESNS